MAHKLNVKDQETLSPLDPVQQGTSLTVSRKHTELSCPNAQRGDKQSSGHAVPSLPRNFCGEQPTTGPGEDVGSGGSGGWMTAAVCVCFGLARPGFR